jgi:hypothetical protein
MNAKARWERNERKGEVGEKLTQRRKDAEENFCRADMAE